MKPSKKPIFEVTPIIRESDVIAEERAKAGKSGAAGLSTAENLADRPLRSHFNRIIFILLAVMALAVILGAVFFSIEGSGAGGNTRQGHNDARPAVQSQ